MVKIGILNDIHGNIEALEAVISYLQDQNCELIIATGDMIAIGPSSNECLNYLRVHHVDAILGNHEGYLLNSYNPLTMSKGEAIHQAFIHQQVDQANIAYLKSLPYVIEKEFDQVKLVFIHYGIKQDGDFYPVNDQLTTDELDFMFQCFDADVICYGHSHISSDLKGNKRYINTGSLGCPHDGSVFANAGIIEINYGKIDYQHIKIPYNKQKVIEHMETIQLPEREFIKSIFYGMNK